MEIKKDKIVSITYELRRDTVGGDLVETVTSDSPLTFLFGAGGMLPKFEENLKGMKIGEEFKFGLNSEDAYGPVVDNAIVDVPIEVFKVEGEIDQTMLQPGNMIPMMDNSGNRLNGMVVEIRDTLVTMDFNHPMAGKNLFFAGMVTEIREATEEELSHGHIHAHAGCDDGGCSDKDGHSCNCSH
jgi:FKBP-type peptidyl-prolyl cis-trans isomerase SlyD